MNRISKIWLVCVVLCGVMAASYGQKPPQRPKPRKTGSRGPIFRKPPNKQSVDNQYRQFLDTQWWIGLRFGGNSTQATPEQRFSAFSPINRPEGSTDKIYDDFGTLGLQVGLDFTFYVHGFSFSLQPNYRRVNFRYSNEYTFQATENPNDQLILNYQQDQDLDYLDIPLVIKYDLTKTRLRPFIQVGGFYSTLINANKTVDITGQDLASGGIGDFQGETLIVGATDLFINSSVGVLGGFGFSYDLGNIRLVLDGVYRYGLNNVASSENRFSDNRLVSIGDALDDITLNTIDVSFSVLFPLRFVTSDFKSVFK